MTTQLAPAVPAAPADETLRLLPITANLLPPEIVAARRHRKIRQRVIAGLIAFVILLGAWYGVARHQTTAARSSLTGAENDVQRLQRQQNAFGDLVRVQSESQAIQAQLASLLANDLQWARLLVDLQAVAPEGIQITGVFGELKGLGGGGNGSNTVRLPSTTTEKQVGALTVTGSGTSKETVAAYVDALGKVPGLNSPLLSEASLLDGVLLFTLRAEITESALGGRYTPKNTTPSGGK